MVTHSGDEMALRGLSCSHFRHGNLYSKSKGTTLSYQGEQNEICCLSVCTKKKNGKIGGRFI